MKTSIIKDGFLISKAEFESLRNESIDWNQILNKYLIENTANNKAICEVLKSVNSADGGGPIVILKSLEVEQTPPEESIGKVRIFYKLKLEWGCSAIKKDLVKSELFDFDISGDLVKLYLFIP